MTKTIATTIASIAVLIALAPAAQAAGSALTSEVTFTYEASEIRSSTGTRQVANRLQKTIKNACKISGVRSLSAINFERKCEIELKSELTSNIEHQNLRDALVGNVRVSQN